MTKFLNFSFYILLLILIIISLYPGSLLGYFFYSDFSQQPNLIKNPFGTTINHFISYFIISLLGFSLNIRKNSFKKITYILYFLSLTLELFHIIIPNRSFEVADLIANILGVLVAYSIVKTYLLFNKQ
mgnify:CR=1 FL=1|jgi:VanZ family protein